MTHPIFSFFNKQADRPPWHERMHYSRQVHGRIIFSMNSFGRLNPNPLPLLLFFEHNFLDIDGTCDTDSGIGGKILLRSLHCCREHRASKINSERCDVKGSYEYRALLCGKQAGWLGPPVMIIGGIWFNPWLIRGSLGTVLLWITYPFSSSW